MKNETDEKIKARYLNNSIMDMQRKLKYCPEPTYVFEPGSLVKIGNLDNLKLIESIYNNKFYLVERDIQELSIFGYRIIKNVRTYYPWYEIRPCISSSESLIRNKDCRLSFSSRAISDILTKAYYFGINFDPDYQRDYVWDQKDKESLIESIFNNIDIGKFCFIHNGYSADYMYEVLDGKQRCRAILDFYENRFPYKGKYFNDLSDRDKFFFETYNISVSEIRNADRKTILKYFLMLNTGGKTMSKDQLEKVKVLYRELN